MIDIALVGNPNSGKTSLFNAMTGLRFTTGNYPGVTVEKRSGRMNLPSGELINVLDLPGTYGLLPRSLDEQVVHDVLLGLQKGTPQPALIVFVVDANNLERNLYLATQVISLGLPLILALNMWDLAVMNGIQINLEKLEAALGVPCVSTVAVTKKGIDDLKLKIEQMLQAQHSKSRSDVFQLKLPQEVEKELSKLELLLAGEAFKTPGMKRIEALCLLAEEELRENLGRLKVSEDLKKQIEASRKQLELDGIDWMSVESEHRYAQISSVCEKAVAPRTFQGLTLSEKIDQVLTHQVWGLLFFMVFMAVVFQSIFSWATIPMDAIAGVVQWLGAFTGSLIPAGKLQSLVVDGMIAGVGNVIVFVPQIFLLFFFIGLAEDFGYMARAAFVLDRLMSKVGLSGKAFLPLLSSFACAIPGVMATRTIGDRNERFATILVAPLMSCSARLPVYTLMIGAFIPATPVFGGLTMKGLTLFLMYFLSIVAGLTMAAIFRKTLLKSSKTPFVFELPPYRFPNLKTVLISMWDRGKEFIERAGTIIFAISIVLWFLSSYPENKSARQAFDAQRLQAKTTLSGEMLTHKLDMIHHEESGALMRSSYAGMFGKALEPVIRPLGFDWKIGIGLVASFAAREVLVSSLAIVYNVGDEADEKNGDLIRGLQKEKDPETGKPLYTPLTAVSLMVFFVFACQCMSTVAIVKRETNSWRWPIFMFTYMCALAYAASFLVYQGGHLLGWG